MHRVVGYFRQHILNHFIICCTIFGSACEPKRKSRLNEFSRPISTVIILACLQITIFTKRCVNLLSIIYISFCRYTGCRFFLFGVFDDFIHAITGVIFSDLIKKLFTTLIRVSSMALMRRRCHALRTATFCQPVILAVAIPS